MRILPLAIALALASAACSTPGTDSNTGDTTSDAGTADSGTETHVGPKAEFIPQPTGECPEFEQGEVTFTVNGQSRNALIWVSDAAKDADGPLVFFWHGAGGSPSEATYAIGGSMQEILDAGGVVVSFYHDPAAGQLPWYLSLGGDDETDLKFADEALGCAIEKVGIDRMRIHSIGFSAGAMNTLQFAALRSGYLASIVSYSGARIGDPTEQDPDNKYAAMLFHGGPNDKVIINFQEETISYNDILQGTDHFSFICNHNKQHTVPSDARTSAWKFLKDHPFGVDPEPYAGGLPDGFPSYCEL